MLKKTAITFSLLIGLPFLLNTTMAADIKRPMSRVGGSAVKMVSPTGVIIPCPNKLHGVNVSIESQYSAPSGWAADGDSHTGYQGQTLIISFHQVLSGKLFCVYGQTSLPSSYRITNISKAIPAGTTCTATAGYKFSCKK